MIWIYKLDKFEDANMDMKRVWLNVDGGIIILTIKKF
jgi:hypothetical protein